MRPQFEVAQIIRDYGENYVQKNEVLKQHKRVLNALKICRTAELGGHVDREALVLGEHDRLVPRPGEVAGGRDDLQVRVEGGQAGLEADLVAKGASAFAGKLGQQVASPLVTLIDDGTMAGEWGNYAVDDEGSPAQRNVLIEDGVLTDYMWDHLRARREGRASSGNGRRQSYQHLPMVRMTNTYIGNGTDDPDDIIAATDRGVFVAQLGGGQVNTATGDFVFGMTEAYLIEDGRITAPIRDGNLIGNGPEVLRNIDMLGDDFEMGGPGTCGKDGQGVPVGDGVPTLRVSSLTIRGTAA